MAEEEGFEPSERCRSTVFKTVALNHSTTLPWMSFYFNALLKSVVTRLANSAGSGMGLPSIKSA